MWLLNKIKGSLGAGIMHLEEARLVPSCVSTAVLCSVAQVGSRELHKAVIIMTNHGSEARQREE